jgi:hypothetical protein
VYFIVVNRGRFGRSSGRPPLIRTMAEANPLWSAPRIHGEPLKLGIHVSQATVAKYMPRHQRPPLTDVAKAFTDTVSRFDHNRSNTVA